MSIPRIKTAPLRRLPQLATLLLLLIPATLLAEEHLEELVVIGITPTRGTGVEAKQIPYHVQSASGEDMEQSQSLDLTDFLNSNIGSIAINEAQNNPLQPDVQYRGFSASPLLGLAQGIAVYQNGVRINEPLGDAVNWDLIPASAIHSINLIGGANPLFGLNTLGGAISLEMKDGFNSKGNHLNLSGGSFGRKIAALESGANNGSLAYYANLHYFSEDGWRDASNSDAINFYGSIGWRNTLSELNLNLQYGDSELRGNGPAPVELMAISRDDVFTNPDITENNMYMFSIDGSHTLTDAIELNGNLFFRRNQTDSFNGDGSEFTECGLGGTAHLLEGLEPDDLEPLGLGVDDVCNNQFTDSLALEDFLNTSAAGLGLNEQFNFDDLTDGLTGTGVLSDSAINNTSDRTQKSYGADFQINISHNLFDRGNRFVSGLAWFRGGSTFHSRLELAELDPVTLNTFGLGVGTFVSDNATSIDTETETFSFYLTDTLEVSEKLSLTLSSRLNNTTVDLADQSGERPELNGEHDFFRINPAAGITYQINEYMNLYGSYSESSRAPTPIELACNDRVFDIAIAYAIAAGDDPADVDLECRLPNAFLADPPLEQVVTNSFELGVRGHYETLQYHLGLFLTVNHDDIIFQTTGRSTGLFANVDETRRAGLESSVSGSWRNLDWFLAYSFIQATFEDDFRVLSPNHPSADPDDGTVLVNAGDHIPGIPQNQLKLGADYYFNDAISLGAELSYQSEQYLRGDESNGLATVDGFTLVNLRGRYRYNEHLEIFARITNLFDIDYETFGLIGEDPSEVDSPRFADFSNPLFLGPGAPRAGFVGIKLTL